MDEKTASTAIARSTDAVYRLREQLQADREDAGRLLRKLASDPNPVVRDWVTRAAPEFLAAEAIPLLEQLSNDRDPDVRSEAMRELVALDRSWARRLAPAYLKMLKSDDLIEAIDAIWRLVEFRETSALSELHHVATQGHDLAVRNNARIAALVLSGQEDALLRALATHEHELMPLWTKALVYLGTQRALDALERYASDAPDHQCRQSAQRSFDARFKIQPMGIH